MLRLFVGIALPPALKLRLSLLASGVPGARWVDPGNYHLTVRFIGEVDEGAAGDVDAALVRIQARRFDLSLAGVGHFGDRMLWAGVEKSLPLVHPRDKVGSAPVRLAVGAPTRPHPAPVN